MHIGYFADLESDDILLMDADVNDLRELGAMFQSLAAGRIKRLVLHRLPFVRAHHGTEIRAVCGPEDRGLRRSDAGNSFVWERSKAGWLDAAEKLAVMVQAPEACHHHLSADDDDVVVSISSGEYGEEWWALHG